MSTEKTYTPELFEPIGQLEKRAEQLNRKQVGVWKDAWLRFRQNKGALIGVALLLVIGLLAIFGPLMNDHNWETQNLAIKNQSANIDGHYMGTDHFGRDLWQRVWYGAKISLEIAFLAVFLDVVIGVTIGGISGYFGGRIDMFIQRFIEVIYSIPNLIIIIMLLMWMEPGILAIAIAIALTGWVPMSRIVRAQILKLRSQEYVLAARTLGASHKRILLKHLIPNVMGPIIIAVTFSIPSAIFFEAFLSFIGLGIRPPEASLGLLISEGNQILQLFPHVLLWPALVLSVLMLAFNLVGDGLRDALDPRMKK
ncbi:oligopeptide transport system permease protein [Thermoactinomyces sp. DSM 45891]|uniref:ABC transporter permease n=1 Tax=Thermoactinomyces sp. DSM 45891 TaxID=1761907 RepID=UPI00091BB3A3|nr:ABC transporter permease [Thermoactinomyces sp. DSM 45891]SFX21038.1 oligopeptide transport system permease protein [Thermoactinomyces sp. DSM 45891]